MGNNQQNLDPFNMGGGYNEYQRDDQMQFRNGKGGRDMIGVASVVTGGMGLLSCILPPIFGVIAVILGLIAVIRNRGGRTLGIIGIILGIVNVIMYILFYYSAFGQYGFFMFGF